MSVELIDKEVSTENLGLENDDQKEIEEHDSKKIEKKEAGRGLTMVAASETTTAITTASAATITVSATNDYKKLEAVLSALVENKVISIRNSEKNLKEKNHLFGKLRRKLEESDKCQTEGKVRKIRTNPSANPVPSICNCDCHKTRCKSMVPSESPADFCQTYQTLAKCYQTSSEPSHKHHLYRHYHHHHHHSNNQINQLCPQQSFENYDASIFYKPGKEVCYESRTESDQRITDKRTFPIEKCLPKQLSTEQWLNSTTSRQTSTETATTSSGYISPTFGADHGKHYRAILNESETNNHLQSHDSVAVSSNGDSETIIDMSKIKSQKTLDAIEESKSIDEILSEQQAFASNVNELQRFKCIINSSANMTSKKCNESCHVLLPRCLSTTCLPTCRCTSWEDQVCQNGASCKQVHPSGGHYLSCSNSPMHSYQKFQYDENYLTLVMNLEDLEFEQEEERRKRRKKRKKRRKERQIRARGLMADELKSSKNTTKVLDPEDLPKRARWTIVATACLLLLMSMLLVGITLRMAPIIDEMVRKENEEMLNSLSRQGAVKEVVAKTTSLIMPALNATKTSPSILKNSSNHL